MITKYQLNLHIYPLVSRGLYISPSVRKVNEKRSTKSQTDFKHSIINTGIMNAKCA